MRRLVPALVAGLSVFAVVSWSSPARAADAPKEPVYRVVDVSLVYLGNPRQFKRPCAVSADRVYRAIPEYREILDKNLTDRDVRYHFLMKQASDKFSAAIRAVAQGSGYDLVAGVGAVVSASAETPAVPDVTDAAVGKLSA